MKKSTKENIKILGIFIVLCIVHILIMKFLRLAEKTQPSLFFIAFLFIVLFIVLIFLLFLKMIGKETFLFDGITRKTWIQMLLLCVSHFLLFLVIFGYPARSYKYNISIYFFFNVINTIVFNAIVFEILFRGLLQRQLSKFLRPWMAITITLVVSVLYNPTSILSVFQAFLTGIFLGIIFYKTGKLILCICYHILNNLLIILFPCSFQYAAEIQLLLLLCSSLLAMYTIRGFMKEKSLKNQLLNSQIN